METLSFPSILTQFHSWAGFYLAGSPFMYQLWGAGSCEKEFRGGELRARDEGCCS